MASKEEVAAARSAFSEAVVGNPQSIYDAASRNAAWAAALDAASAVRSSQDQLSDFCRLVEIVVERGGSVTIPETASDIVKCVLEAIREPTQGQYDALAGAGVLWRDQNSKTIWHAYIDALLKGCK